MSFLIIMNNRVENACNGTSNFADVMRQAITPRPRHTCNIFEIKGLQCTGLY
jgi:hypothetical protein